MDEQNYQNWDDRIYGTGPTQPPKSRGGLMALLLILVIFLCGVVTIMGVLNVKLFRQLRQREQEMELSMSFDQVQTQPSIPPAPTPPIQPVLPSEAAAVQDQQTSLILQQSPQSVENVPMEQGLSLQEIYVRNIDSVVSITSTSSGSVSTGTGVIFDENGYIITNAHVVDRAISVTVQLTDERVVPARILGADAVSDLAVLVIDARDLVPAQFGDSSSLRVGDTVVAIGDPLGVEFRGTYTNGIVSAINRDVEVDGHTMTLIQTNAALNSGNSGGPLINCYGQVIGINTMKISDLASSAGVEGLGFAIPSATVRNVADQLIRQGYVSGRPTLGITGVGLSIVEQRFYDLPPGLSITHVARDSDAWNKGVQEGDILMSVDKQMITTSSELKAALLDREVGEQVQVVIYRGGQQYQMNLTLGEDRG